EEALGLKIDQVYVGNCSNGTMTDLRQVAEILRGRTVRDGCRMIVVPASQRIYREALAEGLLDVFVAAGAMVSTPTCGACFGGETALVVGANFGAGSSREHVPQAMGAWGVRFLIGKSFARIFARNCLNLGLPIVTCAPAAEAAGPGSEIALDLDAGLVEVDGA